MFIERSENEEVINLDDLPCENNFIYEDKIFIKLIEKEGKGNYCYDRDKNIMLWLSNCSVIKCKPFFRTIYCTDKNLFEKGE